MSKNNGRPGRQEVGQIPIEMCNFFECECGSRRFKPSDEVEIVYNRLDIDQTGIMPLQQLVCKKCETPLIFDEDGKKRIRAHSDKKIAEGDSKKGIIHGA